jgi:hypothetical protein
MKQYYLYNEDISGYQQENDLPYSDNSEFISGELNESLSGIYFNDKIKKAFKGQYYQNEIILDVEEGESGYKILEDGYYKLSMKAVDSGILNFNRTNQWWIPTFKNSSKKNLLWRDSVNSSNANILSFEEESLSWNYLGNYGHFKIYDQFLLFYKETNPNEYSVYWNTIRKNYNVYISGIWEESDRDLIYKGELDSDLDPFLYNPKDKWAYYNTSSGSIRRFNSVSNNWENISFNNQTSGFIWVGQFNNENNQIIKRKEEPIGVGYLNFINTEYLDDFWKLEIRCKNDEIFYGKVFIHSVLEPDIDSIIRPGFTEITFDGVHYNRDSIFESEYTNLSGTNDSGLFSRRDYPIIADFYTKDINFDGYTPSAAGGYYEKYAKFGQGNTFNYNIETGYFLNTEIGLEINLSRGHSSKKIDKDRYIFQYDETLNRNPQVFSENGTAVDNSNSPPREVKTPLPSVGVTTDIFGIHQFVQPTSGYLRIEFLGPSSLSTISGVVYNLTNPNIPSNTIGSATLLEDPIIEVPRNNTITNHFIYSDHLKQISRGKLSGEVDVEHYVYISGEIEKEYHEKHEQWEFPAPNPGVYNYSRTWISNYDPGSSYVEKRLKGKITEKVPLYKVIDHFTRDSDYSEHYSYKLELESLYFYLKEEKKKFRVYYDEKFLIKNDPDNKYDNSIVSIKVNGHDITSDNKEDKYYEVERSRIKPGSSADEPEYESYDDGDYSWAEIEITYNKSNWGLVRDFTSYSSRLTQLLDEKGASWTYNSGSKKDIIKVNLNRDIFLDLSHQGQLYLLYIVNVKENNTIDKDFEIKPLRLKLGKVPYTIQDSEQNGGSLSAIYLTEGEQLYLDWGFESSDPDFEKKLYVNEILSVLPPDYLMYPVNTWPYNKGFDLDNYLEVPAHNFNNGVNIDLFKIADRDQAPRWKCEKSFQVLQFRMPPQTFTIKLVISFIHSKFIFHRDSLGIIDADISQTDFLPGDIIKVSFKLDKYHTLSSELPDRTRDNSRFMKELETYNLFLSELLLWNDYNKGYPIKNEKRFSFFIVDKIYKNPIKLLKNNDKTQLVYSISKERGDLSLKSGMATNETLFIDTSIDYWKTREYLNFKIRLSLDDFISLYFVGQNKDIDLWLTPTLIKNNLLFVNYESDNYFYKVEQSGYYAMFVSGSRMGNGTEGIRGLSAGTGSNGQDYSGESLSLSGSKFDRLGDNNPKAPHSTHGRSEGVAVGGNLIAWGKPGADGGPGWYGGPGGDGGDGSSFGFGVASTKLVISVGVWHFVISFDIPGIPGLYIAGGKKAGDGGRGGIGIRTPGVGGKTGSDVTLGLPTSSNGESGSVKEITSVLFFKETNIFLRKDSLLFFSIGKNGNDGAPTALLKALYEKHKFGNLKDPTEVVRDGNVRYRFDGGGGGGGSPTTVSLIGNTDPDYYLINSAQTLLVEGLQIDILEQGTSNDSRTNGELVSPWLSSIDTIPLVITDGLKEDRADMAYGIIRTPVIGAGLEWKLFSVYQCLWKLIVRNRDERDYYSYVKIPGGTGLNYKPYNQLTPREKILPLLEIYGNRMVMDKDKFEINKNNVQFWNLNVPNTNSLYLEIIKDNTIYNHTTINSTYQKIVKQGYNLGYDSPGSLFYFIDSKEEHTGIISREEFTFDQ